MKKLAIAGVVVLLLFPILPQLIPEDLTMERIQEGFEKSDLLVEQMQTVTPQLEAVEQISMMVSGARVEVYRFNDVGKIAKQQEYLKPGAGTVETEAFGLSDLAASVGAAKPKNKPITIARRGMFLLTVTSENDSLRKRVEALFKSL